MWSHQAPEALPPLGAVEEGKGVTVPVLGVVFRPLSRAGTATEVSGLTAASMPGTDFVMWSMPTILGHSE